MRAIPVIPAPVVAHRDCDARADAAPQMCGVDARRAAALDLSVRFKGRALALQLPSTALVADLNTRLAELTGVPPALQRLLHQGRDQGRAGAAHVPASLPLAGQPGT